MSDSANPVPVGKGWENNGNLSRSTRIEDVITTAAQQEGPCTASRKVSDLINIFQRSEREKGSALGDIDIDSGDFGMLEGHTRGAGRESSPGREAAEEEMLVPIFDDPPEQAELIASVSYSAYSDYDYSDNVDPFSDNLDERQESSNGSLFSDNRAIRDNDNDAHDARGSNPEVAEGQASELINYSGSADLSSSPPPPLPPRSGVLSVGAAGTTEPSEAHSTNISVRSYHTSSKNTAPAAEIDPGLPAQPARKGAWTADTKLQDVRIQIPETSSFNRSVPHAKSFPKPMISTGSHTTAIDACGEYMCSVGSTVKVHHLPTAELLLSFCICSKPSNHVDNTDFLSNLSLPAQNGITPGAQHYGAVGQGSPKSFLSIARPKIPKNKGLFYVCKMLIPNNDLKNLGLITSSCIGPSSLNKSSSSSQIKKEKPTAVLFLQSKTLEDSGRYVLLGTDKGSVICVDFVNSHFGQLKSDGLHHRKLVKIIKVKDRICILDESGTVSVWEISGSVIAPIGKFRVPSVENYLRNGCVKSISAYARAERLYVVFGKHIVSVAVNGSMDTLEFAGNSCRELGPITSISSCCDGYVLTGHEDGKISVWDANTLSLFRVVILGSYCIGALKGIADGVVWVGMRTGRIYVYRVGGHSEKYQWILVNSFNAYKSSPILQLTDNSMLLLHNGGFQMITLDGFGTVRLWDGFLADTFMRSLLSAHEDRYCSYRDLKVLICSWNVDAARPKDVLALDKNFFDSWLTSVENPDIIVVCIQEIVDLESTKINARELLSKGSRRANTQSSGKFSESISLWKKSLNGIICTEKSDFKLVDAMEMVGLFQAIFAKTSNIKSTKSLASAHVKTGLKGYHGNKGAVAIRLKVDDSSICFVNCHLSAHQNQVSSRNRDVHNIFKYARFPKDIDDDLAYTAGGDGTLITDHEVIFWSGDLNYRINMNRDRVLQLIELHDWKTLLKSEQLTLQKSTLPGFYLRNFSEGSLSFSPTFKYDVGSNNYDTSEKRRVPSWCDRILYYGEKVRQNTYRRFEVQASDHRPISASFTISVKKIDSQLLSREIEESKRTMLDHFTRKVHSEKVRWLCENFMLTVESSEEYLLKHKGDILNTTRDITRVIESIDANWGVSAV